MSDDWHGWYQNNPGSGHQPTEAYRDAPANRPAHGRASRRSGPHRAEANRNGGTWAVAVGAAGGSGDSPDGAVGGSR